MSSAALLEGLEVHPPRGWIVRRVRRFDPHAVRADLRRIESFYRDRGFFDVKVTGPEVAPEGRSVVLRYRVDEGRPTAWGQLIVKGWPTALADTMPKTAAQWAARLDVRLGRPFRYERYEAAKQRLRALLVNAGYAHATLTGSVVVDRRRRLARARFELDPGPRVVVGEVRVGPLRSLPESFVMHRLAVAPKQRFDPDALHASRGKLYGTGRVGRVRFRWPTEGRPERVTMAVEVDEVPPNELLLGTGLGIGAVHYELRLRAGYVRYGFIDPLSTLRLDVRPAWAYFRSGAGSAGLSLQTGAEWMREDLFVPLLRGFVRVDYRRTEYEAFSTHGPGVGVGLGRSFWRDRWTAGLQLFLEPYRVDSPLSVDVAARYGIQERLFVRYVRGLLRYDGRDRPAMPTSGFWAEAAVQAGRSNLPGGGGFGRGIWDLRGYAPLAPQMVLAARVRLGGRLGGGGPLPVTQRFFAGGAESHRAFARRRLAPFVAGPFDSSFDAAPVGGEASLESSLEVRNRLARVGGQWLGLVLFVDAGDVTPSWRTLSFSRLHVGAGLGLRYETPVGPLRTDVGVRLNRRGPNDPDPNAPFAFQLSLGEAF